LSRGLGDVYKRQLQVHPDQLSNGSIIINNQDTWHITLVKKTTFYNTRRKKSVMSLDTIISGCQGPVDSEYLKLRLGAVAAGLFRPLGTAFEGL
jgi:hypothetical protein